MDGRFSLFASLGLAAGLLGCAHDHLTTLPPTETVPSAEVRRLNSSAKIEPKATTCLAYGQFSEQNAEDSRLTPLDREQQYECARKAYQQALKEDPNNTEALLALARVYAAVNDHQRALEAYTRAVQAHPGQANPYYQFGMYLARRKEWDLALGNLRRAVELDPEHRQYSSTLGFCLARAGQYDESFAVFAKMEGEANAHYDVARMLHHLNRDELCKQHLELALGLEPNLPGAKELLTSLLAAPVKSAAAAVPAPTPAPELEISQASTGDARPDF